MTTENLARGVRQPQKAVAAHKAATDKNQAIADRLAVVKARMTEITAARVSGNATDQEAAEFAALQGDAELLAKMHAEAQAAAKLASDTVHDAYAWFTDAQNAHDAGHAVHELVHSAPDLDQARRRAEFCAIAARDRLICACRCA